MLQPLRGPGLFVTATDTGVGKTVVSAAIASYFRHRGRRAGVCKPAATGCRTDREGLISEDAEFLAHHADSDFPLDLVCPQRYTEPLAPAVAAEREKRPLDWESIDRSLRLISSRSDVTIVEGVGGILVPMDARHTVLDMARWLALPTVIVARPNLGTINHTLLTIQALRSANVPIAGVVINRYPADGAGVAEETNPRAIEKWGKVPVLCLVPEAAGPLVPYLPTDITAPIGTVEWEAKTQT
jgi:dethiobiotin synthetase